MFTSQSVMELSDWKKKNQLKIKFLFGLDKNATTGGTIFQKDLCEALVALGHNVEIIVVKSRKMAQKVFSELSLASSHDIVFVDGLCLIFGIKFFSKSKLASISIGMIHHPFSTIPLFEEPWLQKELKEIGIGVDINNFLLIETHIFSCFDHILTVSSSTRDLLIDIYQTNPTTTHLISPGLSSLFCNSLERISSNFTQEQQTNNVIQFVTVGTICKRKNQLVLITAIDLLSTRIKSRVRLVIVGNKKADKKYAKKLLKYQKEMKNPEIIEFIDEVSQSQLASILLQSQAFLFASKQESFGISLIEAVAAGLPILSYKVGILEEMFSSLSPSPSPVPSSHSSSSTSSTTTTTTTISSSSSSSLLSSVTWIDVNTGDPFITEVNKWVLILENFSQNQHKIEIHKNSSSVFIDIYGPHRLPPLLDKLLERISLIQ